MNERGARVIDRAYKVGIVLFVLCFFAAATQLMQGAANAAMWSGRAPKYGYFDNNFGDSNSPYTCAGHKSAGPVIDNNCYAPGNDAIPASVTTPMGTYDFLFNKYNNPGTYGHATWDKVGVSFIVNTMLGRSPGQGSAGLSGADWAELKSRLSNPNITASQQIVNTNAYGSVDSYFQYLNNDVAYYNDPGFSDNALVFTQAGKVVYVLYYSCANPVGNLAGFAPRPQWTISTGVSVDRTTALPGDTITWTHTIKNNGPDATDQDVTWNYTSSGNINMVGGNNTFANPQAKNATGQFTSTYVPTDNDLGKTVCRSTSAQPRAWNNNGTVVSAPACVSVPYVYELHPVITFDSGGLNSTIVAGGTAQNLPYKVTNDGPTTSKPTDLWVTRCVYQPSSPFPNYTSETDNTQTAQQWQGGGASPPCTVSTANQVFKKQVYNFGPITENAAGLLAGSHICYIVSVRPANATVSAATWRHSPPACLSVLKTPKIHSLGADIRAGTVQATAPATIGGMLYGSWSQYGIFGIGGISGMASASSLAGGAAPGTTAAQQAALTFANTPSLGNFFSQPQNADLYATYSVIAGPSVGPSVGAEVVAAGTHEVRHVNGTLEITGNITYPDNYATVNDIPRVIYVVNGDVKIDASVTRIDAWIIASGTLYTCTDDSGATRVQLTVTTCQNPLTFNGPVSVAGTRLSRTAGADGTTPAALDAPAEVFNLNPANYLSSYNASVSATNIETVYEKELPPRW